MPTESDVLRLPTGYEYAWNKALQETRLSHGRLSMHVIGCGVDLESQRSDWIPHFREVTGIMFVVDLCSYDKALPPSRHNVKLMKCLYLFNLVGTRRTIYTKLMESLYLFEAVANSRLHQQSSVFLFFTGLEAFEKKIIESPLSNHFPSYDGGEDVDRAVDYISGLFHQINTAQLRIHSQVLRLEDEDRFQLDSVFETLSERLSPRAKSDLRSAEGSTRIHRAASPQPSTARICSMNLSKRTACVTTEAALRVG